ncbi:MAG: hypothetical protein KatS3mg016_0024 [Fimbriimonadales bacterium]|nr:MAG: hypothetical protein KatS3mg016_0024 [Fimbriimonadales bacterium]
MGSIPDSILDKWYKRFEIPKPPREMSRILSCFALKKPKILIVSALEISTVGAFADWSLLRWTNAEGDALGVAPPSAQEPIHLPPSPFGIACPIALQGVGCVYLWTDSFTSRLSSILLEREFAQRYLKKANALVSQYTRRGVPMEQPQQLLQMAQTHATHQQWAACLTYSVQAAEVSTTIIARTRLERMHGRSAFLWGVFSESPEPLKAALKPLAPPANLIHLIINLADPQWEPVIQQAQSARIAIAASLSGSPIPQINALREAMSRVRGLVRYWTLATHAERHPNSATPALSELCESARAIDFGVVRLLHGTHSFRNRWSAYSTLERYVEAGVPFEAIHLEWHWYDGTLYDLDQLLERYGELGKPIHLELSLPPEAGYEVFSRVHPLLWLESACVIALSKPYVVALRVSLTDTELSAGALTERNTPSSYWEQITEIAAWNRYLQE